MICPEGAVSLLSGRGLFVFVSQGRRQGVGLYLATLRGGDDDPSVHQPHRQDVLQVFLALLLLLHPTGQSWHRPDLEHIDTFYLKIFFIRYFI